MVCVCRLTQGAALGYVLLPLRGVSLTAFDTPHAICCVGVAACGWRGVAAWVWQGCHTLLLIHLRRPMRMSAPTDADVCTDRCGCLRRPMRMSAPTDADVCVDRYGCLRRPMRMSASTDANHAGRTFLLWQVAKLSAARLFTTLLALPYRNNQQCIIPKKAVRHSCHTAFYIYKYRLNGNVGVIFPQGQGERNYWLQHSFA